MKLIDKDALVSEIERRKEEIDEIGTYLSPKGVLTNLLCHLDTIEVKSNDAFIEKACGWLRNYSHNYANNALGKEYLVNDFKNYMKGD